MVLIRTVLIAFIALWGAGCSSLLTGGLGTLGGLSGPRQELPVPLEITVYAAENVNPAENQRPSPVLVSVFEMTGTTAFQSADFFALQQSDSSVLGEELIHSEQQVLLPGETRVIRRTAAPNSRYLGVVVGFRDLEGSVWRAVAPLPAPYLAGRVISGGVSPTAKLYVVVTDRSVVVRDAQNMQ
ncbi:type VI secretion system lipoprotein TssJ [Lampropedia aestuarii]|nr:type VI secretion system lipoprotein TssJ [Lampropedia aestuarii]MDH5857386.1 type VI secretion system lipoprotein TssJ [Lampropedia aestuarii]